MAESQKGGTRVAFVDFIYAIVVGTAFALVPPVDLSVRFFGMLFLILVVLEDFYLYHTQIAVYADQGVPSFSALVFEIFILLAWYLAAMSFPDKSRAFLICLSGFFVLKWFAGFAHFASLGQLGDWRFHRNHCFFFPALIAIMILFFGEQSIITSSKKWISLVVGWLIQVSAWWTITRLMERKQQIRTNNGIE